MQEREALGGLTLLNKDENLLKVPVPRPSGPQGPD